jgi:hypothetical protein
VTATVTSNLTVSGGASDDGDDCAYGRRIHLTSGSLVAPNEIERPGGVGARAVGIRNVAKVLTTGMGMTDVVGFELCAA